MRSGRFPRAWTRAYDRRLILACALLDLPEHLDGRCGMQRDLERVRVESEIEYRLHR